MSDYYQVLKIPFHSDSYRIRKAYYRLARIWHPDKNQDSVALAKFQEISIAYQTLSNENSRMEYDFNLIMDGKCEGMPEENCHKNENKEAQKRFEDWINEIFGTDFGESQKIGKKRSRK